MIGQDVRIFGINVGAMIFSVIPEINTVLQTCLLYTSDAADE